MARKNTGKGQQNKKKNPNFGLCACAKLKYCKFMYLILRKSTLLVENRFVSKFEDYLALWQPKIRFNGKKRHFLVKHFGFEGFILLCISDCPVAHIKVIPLNPVACLSHMIRNGRSVAIEMFFCH